MNNVEFLFVGGLFPKETMEQIMEKSKGVVQNSANNFQWAFLNGLERNLRRSLPFITAPFLGYFPQYYSDLFVKSGIIRQDNENITCVGYINLPVIKKIFIYRNLRKSIKKWATSKPGDKIVIVYSMNYAYLKAVVDVKKKNPKLKVCLIVADLPNFPADSSNLYTFYIKKIEKPIVFRLLKSVDSFVFLTDKMSELLNDNKRPWVRIEGLYDEPVQMIGKVIAKEKFKTILYSGAIDNRYGIKELLGAFDSIKSNNYRLWICGGGISQDFVTKAQAGDPRITFFGNLPHIKVLELQKMATVVINPRNTIGDYNEYSFPSKTMEYLASGTPAIIYRLPGIPEEYFHHCFTVPDNSIATLASIILNVCELSPAALEEKGMLARDFILKNKNPEIQCARALNMLYSLHIQ